MQNLATTYKDIGDYQKASQYYSKALKMRRTVLGDSDDKTRKTAKHLAEVNQGLLLNNSDEEASPVNVIYKRDRRRVDSGISVD